MERSEMTTCACAEVAISAEGLTLSPAPGAPIILSDVNFEVPLGCRAALVGPNGAGKSTLLKAISGMIKPSSGRLMTNGHSPRLGRSDVALLAQRTSLTPGFPCTVERLALMGRLSRRLWAPGYSQEDVAQARAAVDAVGLNSLRHRLLHELSGGQLQRALLARALCQGATLLLLDEPYAGIDQASRQALNEILFGPALNGVTLLLSTHDSMDSSLCDRIFTADAGKISLRVACDGQHPHRHVALDS